MSVVVKAVEKVLDTAVKTVEAVIKDPLPTLATIGLSLVGIPPAVTQAAITAARGGDLEDIAKSAAIAYATPTVAAKLAPTVSTAVNSVVTNQAAANALTAATSQSLVAGSLTAATGGDWQQAAAGAFAGSMAASGYDNYVAPEVMAQAKSLGLSAESHANIQGALKSGIASGAGAAATGGDFATGFANAVVESGWENLTAKASEGLQDVKKSFLKDSDIKDNNPTFAGVSDALVDEVPMSLEGQLAQISSTPKSPEYGKQFGPALAASEYTNIPGYEPVRISGYETITDNVPEDVAGELLPLEFSEEGFSSDNLKRAAITGNEKLLKDATYFGQLPTSSEFSTIDQTNQNILNAILKGTQTTGENVPLKTDSGYLSGKDLNRIISKADESAAAAVEARLAASVAPTPENIAAAEQAELAAELDQKALDGLTKTDVPVGVEGEAVAAPTIDQTNESILKAILGGGETTGAPAPVAGQTGQDLLTVEDLQQAGLSDSSSFGDAGGISDPIDSQQGPLGTMTGNIPMPQTMQRPMSGAPMPQPGAPMPQGGLQFSSFNRVGTPTYFGGAPSTLSALGPLSDLDMQSIMMMSPEEYAARTKSGNIFRVARGGLIALKKQR